MTDKKTLSTTFGGDEMKRIILMLFITLVLPAVLQARSVDVQWTHDGSGDGFKIYEHMGDSVGSPFDIPGGDVRRATIDVPDDGVEHTYMITAYNEIDESDYSDPLTIYPDRELPEVKKRPGKVYTFTFAGSVEVAEE